LGGYASDQLGGNFNIGGTNLGIHAGGGTTGSSSRGGRGGSANNAGMGNGVDGPGNNANGTMAAGAAPFGAATTATLHDQNPKGAPGVPGTPLPGTVPPTNPASPGNPGGLLTALMHPAAQDYWNGRFGQLPSWALNPY